MKTKYVYFSLIMLLLVPVAGPAQELPKNGIFEWVKKAGKAERLMNRDTGMSLASERPQLIRDHYQTKNGESWEDQEETLYHYNGSSRVAEEVRYINGSGWEPHHHNVYQYNESGVLEAIVTQIHVGYGVFVNSTRTVFHYGYHYLNGELILNSTEDYIWTGNDWSIEFRDKFEYEIHPNSHYLTTWIGEHLEGTEMVEYEKYVLVQTGDNVVQTTYIKYGGWEPVGKTIYHNTTIAGISELTAQIGEQMEAYVSIPQLMVMMPEMTEQHLIGFVWVSHTMTTKIPMYDWMSGRLMQWKTEVLEWDEDEEVWITEMVYLVDYDEEIKPVTAAMEFLFDEESYRFQEDVFTYNDRGLLETGTLRMNLGEGLMDMTRHTLTWAGTGTSIGKEPEMPVAFDLGIAYPNPFNPSTVIPYETGVAGHVTIRVYDILGRLVSTLYNGPQSAGKHQVRFDAAGLTSGKYLVRMEAPGYSQTRAVTLLK
jgi:hypothetical protein